MLMATIGRIAGVGRAAVANWRRRHPDFPAPAGGTATHSEFARLAAVAWLLAHDKITVPSGVPSARLCCARTARARGCGAGWMTRGWSWPSAPLPTTGCQAGRATTTPTSWRLSLLRGRAQPCAG
ncbi:hypothetical protein EF915_34340 [Streptomyces sp. WAC08401]|nr:hypothetical protein EF915_34340 [Streptomyces sp. WAC08401]